MILDCDNCKYDDQDDLEYCMDHRPDIACNQCGDIRPVHFESDYVWIMEEGDTTCISCAVQNRIRELEEMKK